MGFSPPPSPPATSAGTLRPDLQISPFKGLPPPPPPAVLLNKQPGAKTRGSHAAPLVVRLFYVSGSVYRFKRCYFDGDPWPSSRLASERLAKQGRANSEREEASGMRLWEGGGCSRRRRRRRRLAARWQAEGADPVSAPVLRSNPAWYVSGSERLRYTVAIRCRSGRTRQVHI